MQHLRDVIIVQSWSWIVVRLYDDNEDNDDKDVNTHKPIKQQPHDDDGNDDDYKPIDNKVPHHQQQPHDDDGNDDDYKPIHNKVPHTTRTALTKLTTKDETS